MVEKAAKISRRFCYIHHVNNAPMQIFFAVISVIEDHEMETQDLVVDPVKNVRGRDIRYSKTPEGMVDFQMISIL